MIRSFELRHLEQIVSFFLQDLEALRLLSRSFIDLFISSTIDHEESRNNELFFFFFDIIILNIVSYAKIFQNYVLLKYIIYINVPINPILRYRNSNVYNFKINLKFHPCYFDSDTTLLSRRGTPRASFNLRIILLFLFFSSLFFIINESRDDISSGAKLAAKQGNLLGNPHLATRDEQPPVTRRYTTAIGFCLCNNAKSREYFSSYLTRDRIGRDEKLRLVPPRM